jgi:hypothetical protein
MAETSTTYTLYTAGEYAVLANSEAYCNIHKITGVEECFQDNGVGTILKKEFRYSIDNLTYSEFQEISSENLSAAGALSQAWFQFRYILLTGGPVTLQWAMPIFTTEPLDPYAGYVTPRIEDQSKIYAFPVTYRSNFLWEPYKMNRAVRLYKDLNLMVNNLFGHDVHYYRALPQGRSRDVFLMEYSLYEHAEKQCIKVVVPENAFPDNKLSMGPFGVDFEMPFEVQIDKDYFQTIFGEGTGPQKRDVIYFPRTSRIYEISSSYLFRDFMNDPLYFKVTLIKWLPKSNVEESESLNDLESFTVSATKLFGEAIKEEEIKITNPEQFNVARYDDDPVRSFLANDQEIVEEKILNYYTLISEFNYKMSALMDTSEISVDLSSTSNLVKDTTYYARFSPSSVQPDAQLYYSMKKFKYKGANNGKAIFEFSEGNSQAQASYNAAQIFGPGSLFRLFNEEYDGSAVLVEGDSIIQGTGSAGDIVRIEIENTDNPGTFTRLDNITVLDDGTWSASLNSPLVAGQQIRFLSEENITIRTEVVEKLIATCDTAGYTEFYYRKPVQYKGTTEFLSTQDRAFSAWFRVKENVKFPKVLADSFSLDIYTRELTVTLSKNSLIFVGDSIEITRVSSSQFMLFGTVTEIISQNSFKMEIPQYVLDFVQASFSSWTGYTDLQFHKNPPKMFISSLDDASKGIKIELFGERHFRVTMNTEIYFFSLPNNLPALLKDKWYGLFINFSNIFKQLTLNVWRMQWSPETNLPATTDLSIVLNKTVPMTQGDRSSSIPYFLKPSSMDLTNVRLFNRVAETDKQPLVLNQNIVKDAHLAIIIDNALPQSKNPFIGRTR